jgi:peptidoglycan/LPS O-acetylase OafA/YrhL
MNASKIIMSLNNSKEGRDFEKLVMWASSFSIALLAGFLASLKQVNPVIQIRLTISSGVAFVLGGILTALYLRLILRANKRRRTLLVVGAVVACVLGYFAMGIMDTAQENRSDVMVGTVIAVTVLSFVAFVLWRVVRYFEADAAEPERPDEFFDK